MDKIHMGNEPLAAQGKRCACNASIPGLRSLHQEDGKVQHNLDYVAKLFPYPPKRRMSLQAKVIGNSGCNLHLGE